ncbi:MAG TPA: phosphotransferase [Pedomonas sp.]|uniref:phosphotransferase n=1 Tax=Pedomonas sp. TaxID=2976421 RepID=UPI002F4156C8
MSTEALFAGTGAVRQGFAFDEAALADWMRANVDGFEGPLVVRQFKGGQSNPTYHVSTPGREYVLRRRPPGKIAAGAHAVDREARVMSALGADGFPVPHIFGLCMDETVIGTAFYVMEFVRGRVFWSAQFEPVPAQDRPLYFGEMNRLIADLHQRSPQQLGLEDFGKKGNYFARQIARWSRQYLTDESAGRDENMDRLIEWLPRHIPQDDETCVIHGDFRADNMVFHPTEPRVLAVLDWELSTLGHPLGDFVNHLMMYRLPPTILSGLKGVDLVSLNLPTEDAYLAAYCARTGRERIDNLDFLFAFTLFRLAAIYHGIRARALRGNASSAHALELASTYAQIAQLAWEQTGA